MAKRYQNAPVREALCEIYFTGSRWDDTTQGMFYERIKGTYSTKQPVTEFGVEVRIEKDRRGALFKEAQSRMRYVRPDGSRIVQLAPDLLVVNQLQPYPHFNEWKPEATGMAQVYSEVASPKAIRQMGVRYINDIVIPTSGPRINLEDYFTVYPQIPSLLGGEHGPYMLRLQMPSKAEGHSLVITFAMNPSNDPTKASFTLDLYDIYSTPFEFSIDEIEKHFKESHDLQIEPFFEAFMTDKLRALFQGGAR